MIVGWVISPAPNQTTILGAFRQGCKGEFGPPSHCYIDNGKDYDSFAFHGRTKSQRKKMLGKGYVEESKVKGLFGQLGITVTFAIPYNARAKIIERYFNTLESQFGKTFETYCGNNPMARPDDLQDRLDRGVGIPAMEDVVKSYGRYLDEVYHVSPHSGNGMDGISPIAFMRSNQVARRVADEHVLDLLLQIWSKPVDVTKNGVTLNSIHYGIGNIKLMAYQGHKVRLACDPDNIAEVRVIDLEGRFICSASASGLMNGTKDEDRREAIRMQSHIKKALKQADDVRHLAHRDITELALTAAAQRAKDQFGRMPEPGEVPLINPIRTELDAALMAKVRPFKKVSGDELNPIRLPDSNLFESVMDTSDDASNLIEERLLKLSKPK
jgi:putative transposase